MFLKTPQPSRAARLAPRAAPAFLAIVFFASLIHSASLENQIIDESVHLSAGYSYLLTHDFRLNPEHPALLKQLSALPLLFLSPRLPTDHPSFATSDQWKFGDVFMYENSVSADQLLFWGRLPTMILGVATLLVFYFWVQRQFGGFAAFFLGLAFVLDPTIVAHSRYVTSDLGVTLGFLWSVLAFVRWLERPSKTSAAILLAGITFTVLTKFSGVFVFVVLGLIWGFMIIQRRVAGTLSLRDELWKIFKLVIPGVLLMLFAIWTVYHFQTASVGQVFADRIETIPLDLRELRLPALSYVRGFGAVWGHTLEGHSSYLLGETSIHGGWWYYFPVAFLTKATPIMLILLGLLFVVIIKRVVQRRHPVRRALRLVPQLSLDVFAPAAMVVSYGLVAIFSNINIGVRHLLPLFPFLLFLCGFIINLQFSSSRLQRIWRPLLMSILLFSGLSSAFVYPHVLTYFNPFAGGPRRGGAYLVDSNLDWGQDLKKLKRFLDQDGISTIAMQYFGKARVAYYGIDETPLPTSEDLGRGMPLPAHAAISATMLFSTRDEYRWLFDRTPTARIGNSIYYYDLTADPDPTPTPAPASDR